jgi:molybdate transport system substrate-binding protein
MLLAAVTLAACGAGGGAQLRVSAAASLRTALSRYGASFRDAAVHFSFAGSDALAAQIEQGVRPDVFASADAQLPDALYARHLVERPVLFASNELVVAVPRGSAIRTLADLQRPGLTLALGTASVPVGIYAARVLGRLPAAQRRRILANVRDREPDVTAMVGRLLEGAVDAALLYATDVSATGGALRAIPLERALQPRVAYAAAVLRGSAHPALARRFVEGLLSGTGAAELRHAGFLAPPGR